MSNPRLFIAINLPKELRELLYEWQGRLSGSGLNIKWVEKPNLHLTLEFLGETERDKVKDLQLVLSRAAEQSRAFSLGIKGMGTFPSLKQPRVIWMGLSGQLPELSFLQKYIRQGLTSGGFSFDQKPFRPHLTLGRVKDINPGFNRELLQEVFSSAENIHSQDWKIEQVDLMQSELMRPAPRYTILESFNLRY